ncbi:exopolyphosphatase [Agrilactobacillus composti DSM 18527 = JCM 14202]|uniref:Ppx/GppA phosphatase family protein n=1 Tax=Agrilactobacillus composti TaxID=398555 RepID=UPI00042DEED4|nr:hypothetical protein [Agrilactobacillus composti]GAF39386.1 exopolyphosphatase [Agrilactobacillus composti DSM 18527 = JCM 14202]
MARKQKLIAVVVIGAQNIFLQIADITSRQIIESVHYDIDLGEDIFSEKVIHSQTVNEISTALFSVQQLLTDYQVPETQCYATHSFHEADNGEFVRDQLFERTGFQITWLSQSQEALFRSQATNAYMGDFPEIIAKNAVLIDISSGSVELTAYSSGKFIFSRNLKLGHCGFMKSCGTLRLPSPIMWGFYEIMWPVNWWTLSACCLILAKCIM